MIDVQFEKLMAIARDEFTSIDLLSHSHQTMLQNILSGCFLTSSTEIILKTLLNMFKICNRALVLMEQQRSIQGIENEFDGDVRFLFRIFDGGEAIGVGMSKFLMRLDFNGMARCR